MPTFAKRTGTIDEAGCDGGPELRQKVVFRTHRTGNHGSASRHRTWVRSAANCSCRCWSSCCTRSIRLTEFPSRASRHRMVTSDLGRDIADFLWLERISCRRKRAAITKPESLPCLRALRIFPALTVEITLSAADPGPAADNRADLRLRQRCRFLKYFGNIIGWIHFELPGVFEHNPASGIVNKSLLDAASGTFVLRPDDRPDVLRNRL